jgi:hypothetical protein
VNKNRGATLLEVTVGSLLLILLMGLNLMILKTGLSGMNKVDARSDLLQSLQVVGSGWAREVTRSSADGASIEETICSLPSPRDDLLQEETQGVYAHLLWRRYRVYYHLAGAQELWRRDVNLTHASQDPRPLERLDVGSGVQSLAFYAQNGRRLSREIQGCTFSRQGNILRLTLEGRRSHYGNSNPEIVTVSFAAEARN